MVQVLTIDKLLKEIQVIINQVEKSRDTNIIIPRSKMAIFRVAGLSDNQYETILKEEIRPTDEDLFKEMKKAKYKRAFRRLIKCDQKDLVQYGLIINEDLFTDEYLLKLEDRYRNEVGKREREVEKYYTELQEFDEKFKDWQKIPDNTEPPPEPPPKVLDLLDEDLDPIEWLLISLKDHGIKLDKAFMDKFIGGMVSTSEQLDASLHLDFCTNINMDTLYVTYPNIAKKILSNDLIKTRTGRTRRLAGKDLFTQDFTANTGVNITQASKTWGFLSESEKKHWNMKATNY